MRKILFIALALTALAVHSYAQEFSEFTDNNARKLTLGGDNNSIQVGGRVSGYYEFRWLKPGNDNYSHNGWAMKDGDLDVLGRTASKFVYEFHFSLLDLATAAATQNTAAPDAPGIKAGYLEYRGWPVRIKFGFDKVPFSQGSLNDVWASPMQSHANLYSGDLFSRRDFGITLNYRTWKERINLYGGVYSGLGENFFEYGNDASGRFEYIGRAEFSFPGKMKYCSIDEENSAKPQFRIGIDGRYEDKRQPAGQSILTDEPDAIGPYGIKLFDGKRLVYGADAMLKYKGISALFEADMMKCQPTDPSDLLYAGTPASFNRGYVKAGGIVTGLNYNFEKIHSVFSVQYEHFNTNDLQQGEQEWMYYGYAYKVDGFNSVFKIEYYKPTLEDHNGSPLKYYQQIRVGYQVVF